MRVLRVGLRRDACTAARCVLNNTPLLIGESHFPLMPRHALTWLPRFFGDLVVFQHVITGESILEHATAKRFVRIISVRAAGIFGDELRIAGLGLDAFLCSSI